MPQNCMKNEESQCIRNHPSKRLMVEKGPKKLRTSPISKHHLVEKNPPWVRKKKKIKHLVANLIPTMCAGTQWRIISLIVEQVFETNTY